MGRCGGASPVGLWRGFRRRKVPPHGLFSIFVSFVDLGPCVLRAKTLGKPTLNMIRSVAQPGSASGLGPEGREFESLCPDQSN